MYTARFLYPQSLSTGLLPMTSNFKLVNAHRIGQKPIHWSLHAFCHETGDDEEFSSLTEEHLKQVYTGVYPTNFPREAIRLKTTPREHFLLSKKFDSDESDKPKAKRLHFNRKKSATSILHRPTPTHEAIVRATRDNFFPKKVANSFEIDTNLTFHIGADGGPISQYNPDFAISSDSRPLFLALEVGFGERYDDLLDTAKEVLLKSLTTKFFVIVKIVEKPLYQSPLKLSDHFSKSRSEIPIPLNLSPENCHRSDADPEGPLMVNGLRWVGKISAFWEVWSRDALGNPIIHEERVSFYGPDAQSRTLKLDLTELDENCGEISIDSSVFAQAVHKSRFQLAVYRCNNFIMSCQKEKKP
ncbi:hypothetical protein ACJ72_01000 [Emergomyces africanus]|uniref:Uncharacterized protein n=1 Tax=Emergomyces africanus TaxID=1955775 RepID=A0A1B7P6G8_9EURO|nr:hypothetical protein ACJ72_01000 [Emergomyces africanus]